ncbi:MAG: hypothetical protein Q8L26_07845 [Candidatus Omnitrophota bacterium]|nr:hypothetical protein [Candidatus Omnitrophota bacterium]
MPQKIKLRVGDTIDYGNGRKGQIGKIRIISSGKFVEEYEYDGDGHDLVLTVCGDRSVTNLWVKDTRIHIVPAEKKR